MFIDTFLNIALFTKQNPVTLFIVIFKKKIKCILSNGHN